ncbi:MAG: thiol-disulfide oxidoreductase DCC family protein [Alphaproteobacteria bacterium]
MSEDGPVILFDGVCHLCSGGVVWLARRDPGGVMRFAPMQSDAARRLLAPLGIDPGDMASWLLLEGGRVWRRSGAALRLVRYLPWYWRWLGLVRLLPEGWRDGLYDLLARNRYRWFGKRSVCFAPDAALSAKFLEGSVSSQPR